MTHTFSFPAIGTYWTIDLEAEISKRALDIRAKIMERIEDFDRTYSRFRTDSFVRQLQTPGQYGMPPDGFRLFQFYETLYNVTNGRVTPLIGSVMESAGYDDTYSFKTGELHVPPRWVDSLSYTRTSITVKQPVHIDVGAAGKGYLVDCIAELLQAEGYKTFTVNAGGDIKRASEDEEGIVIGLEDPFDRTRAVGTALLRQGSICASSGSRRKWGRFHHIIDPERLVSPTDIAASWVMADDAMVADGIATALFFTPASKLQHDISFAYALLRPNKKLEYSSNFPIEVFV